MSDPEFYHDDLKRWLFKEVIDWVKGHRFDLEQNTTGSLPPTQLPPAGGGSGSGGGGTAGGVVLENDDPQDVGTAPDAGTNSTASRGDHQHALPATGVTAATYGDATHTPQITVDAQGRLTAASSTLITGVTPSAHHTTHQHGGSDEVATATPGANAIPKAGSGGKLDTGWVPDFVASGASHASGGVPDPGSTAGATKFLREDATWAVPAGGSSLTIEEVDGNPTESAPTKLIFPNGTLSVTSHEVTYTPAGGGGGGNTTSTGAVGSEPGSPSAGDVYFENNGFAIERYSGSVWARWGPIYPITAPPTSSWAWVNQGGATVDTTNGGIYLTAPTASGDNFRIYKRAAPTAPYTITAMLLMRGGPDAPFVGLCWRESGSGKFVAFGLAYSTGFSGSRHVYGVIKYNSETSFSAFYASPEATQPAPIWWRIQDDNTNRKCLISADGQHWHQIHSVSRTDFITADEVGIFANSGGTTYDTGLLLASWG